MPKQGDFDQRRSEVEKKFRSILDAKDTTRQERKEIGEQMAAELADIAYDECRFVDSLLFKQAIKLDVDVPSHKNEELWDDAVVPMVLSTKGRLTLRKAIDDEKVRRRDVAVWWWKTVIIPGIAAATGLVGALTGLFAVLHHGGK
jgi:hypothetical protein